MWETQVTGLYESAVILLMKRFAFAGSDCEAVYERHEMRRRIFEAAPSREDQRQGFKNGQIREGQLHLVDLAGSEGLLGLQQ